ncbi:serine hydrolase domain-containing protein [Glycomyces arizonensis]|uniref:serine hydrolase domain-containing protein n=1 Tax=Glycomyces arizonensis TaxID=256035 RepID=UPI000400CE4D|nr:serine hydrolase domain-containing protein [Glycomyces arizonensis]
MHHTLAAALAAALATGAPTPPAQLPTDYAELDAFVERRLEDTQVPGAAWAIVSSDGIEHTGLHGLDGDGEPVTEATPFLWGSVAKPVTATAVMTLVEDGAIDLDEPVTAYLPDFRLADEDRSDRITVRHLLEQTSGIPEGTGITDRFGEREDPYGEAVADLAGAEPLAEPGEAFEYASANYLVLGAVVEAVSGEPYAAYLREAVLDPLGMDGAVATADDAESLPDGHTYAFGRSVALDARFDPTGPSYGYLGGTVTDLGRFAMAHLGGGAPVLEAASVERMHTGAAAISETSSYGLGWYVNSRHDGLDTPTVWHVGATPGYSASVILLPELDRALVMVQNAYGYFQDGPLVGTMFDAARLLAGGEPGAAPPDSTYPLLLGALTAAVLAAAAITVWTVRRLRRGGWRPASRRRVAIGMAAWLIGMTGVAYAAIAVPLSAAPSAVLVALLAPDVAGLLAAVVVGAIAVAVVRTWAGVLRLRRTPD